MKHTAAYLTILILATAGVEAKPLKVFILAGQSNMEGPASVNTFDYIGDDPATAPMLRMMRGADGKPAVCKGAWISYLTGERNFEIAGKLTAGYGSMWGQDPTKPGDKIGPEFTFGLTMDAAFDEPVLIIKAAWGGKSLHTDFRPPSAGPYVMPKETQALWDQHPRGAHGIPKAEDRPKWNAEKVAATGVYYRLMMEHVKKVLADPKKVVPDYDAAQGYEIVGFAWLQGFNDMVDGQVYPKHNQPDRFDLYSELLAHFIRDVRKDLNAPKMPFVIGVMGVGGLKDQSVDMLAFRRAMAAPAAMLEFKGNVAAVQTAPFWSDELGAIADEHEKVNQMRWFLDSKHKDHPNADGHMTDAQKNEYLKKFEADLISPAEAALWKRGASNAGYHYLGCAKTFALMGKAFAEATLAMMKRQKSPVPDAAISAPLAVLPGATADPHIEVIDPMVFVDDDGSAYLYFGQGKCMAVQLNDDMISFDHHRFLVPGGGGHLRETCISPLRFDGKGTILPVDVFEPVPDDFILKTKP